MELNEEEQLLIITRLHQVSSHWGASCIRVQQRFVGGLPSLHMKEGHAGSDNRSDHGASVRVRARVCSETCRTLGASSISSSSILPPTQEAAGEYVVVLQVSENEAEYAEAWT